jgi:hypothetical protein
MRNTNAEDALFETTAILTTLLAARVRDAVASIDRRALPQ